MVGTLSSLEWVDSNDPRLSFPGIPGVSIVILKAETRRRLEEVGRASSCEDGSFNVPINSPGAGFFEETWMMTANGGKYGSAQSGARLPFNYGDKHLLIMLEHGSAAVGESGQHEDLEGQLRSIRGFEAPPAH